MLSEPHHFAHIFTVSAGVFMLVHHVIIACRLRRDCKLYNKIVTGLCAIAGMYLIVEPFAFNDSHHIYSLSFAVVCLNLFTVPVWTNHGDVLRPWGDRR